MVSFHLILKLDGFLTKMTQNRYVEEGRLKDLYNPPDPARSWHRILFIYYLFILFIICLKLTNFHKLCINYTIKIAK